MKGEIDKSVWFIRFEDDALESFLLKAVDYVKGKGVGTCCRVLSSGRSK